MHVHAKVAHAKVNAAAHVKANTATQGSSCQGKDGGAWQRMPRQRRRRVAAHGKAKMATYGSAWQGKDGDVWQCMPRQRQRRRAVHGKAKTAAQGSACQAQCSGACQGKDSDAGQCMPRQRPRQRRRAFMSMPRQKHMRVAGAAPKQKRHSRCGFGSGIKCIRQNRRAAHLLRKLAEP
jgi:hypothetical protein